jgi:hypothetical protein
MTSRIGWFRSVLVGGLWLLIWCSAASAHGGMAGPDELGPPVIISTILGIGGYWAVILWPSRKKISNTRTNGRRPSSRRIGRM